MLASERDVPVRFVAPDIKNASYLCRLIAGHRTQERPGARSTTGVVALRREAPEGAVAEFLRMAFETWSPGMLHRLCHAPSITDTLRAELLAALNWVIDPSSSHLAANTKAPEPVTLWAPERFKAIRLSPETRRLLAQYRDVGGPGSPRLNRYLIADAFPSALKRVPQWPATIPYSVQFPKSDELHNFNIALRKLAAMAGLRGGLTPNAVARIAVRRKSLGLLEAIRLLVERLLMLPPHPRLQILAAHRGKGADALAMADAAHRRVVEGSSLDFRLTSDISPPLSNLLAPGTSEALQANLVVVKAFVTDAPPRQLPEEVRVAIETVVEHAVAAEVRIRTLLWDQFYGGVRDFCDWLHSLCVTDVKGFVATILDGKDGDLEQLGARHWKRFPTLGEAPQIARARRLAEERLRKRKDRAKASKALGVRRDPRKSSATIAPNDAWYYVQ